MRAPIVPNAAPTSHTAPAALRTTQEVIERVFRHALGRPASESERRAAEEALKDPSGSAKPYAPGLADLLWAIVMKPEFQLVY